MLGAVEPSQTPYKREYINESIIDNCLMVFLTWSDIFARLWNFYFMA